MDHIWSYTNKIELYQKEVLRWNPQNRRKMERLKRSWRRIIHELTEMNKTWIEV